MKIKEIEIKK